MDRQTDRQTDRQIDSFIKNFQIGWVVVVVKGQLLLLAPSTFYVVPAFFLFLLQNIVCFDTRRLTNGLDRQMD